MNDPKVNQNNGDSSLEDILNDIPSSALKSDTNTPKVDSELTNLNKPVVKEVPLNNAPIEEPSKEPENDTFKFSDTNKTLGTLKPDKQKSPVSMIILFVILILFIAFMPQIITLVNTVLGTNLNANNGVNTNTSSSSTNTNTSTNNETNTSSDVTSEFYDINASTTITVDKLKISNLTKNSNNTISFNILNTGTSSYSFTKKLFLEFYDDNNTFISRSVLDYSDTINSNATINTSVYLSSNGYTSATKVNVILRSTDEYPSISLTSNTLVCKNSTNVITYTFSNDLLTKILDVYTYTKGSDATTYNNDALTYKSRISKMDALTGVEAVLTENSTGFITSTSIDYGTAKYSDLTYKVNYYDSNTSAKVVSFEMDAKGFTCN